MVSLKAYFYIFGTAVVPTCTLHRFVTHLDGIVIVTQLCSTVLYLLPFYNPQLPVAFSLARGNAV